MVVQEDFALIDRHLHVRAIDSAERKRSFRRHDAIMSVERQQELASSDDRTAWFYRQ